MFVLMALAQVTIGLGLHQINAALKVYFSSGAAVNAPEPVELVATGAVRGVAGRRDGERVREQGVQEGAGGDAAGCVMPDLGSQQVGYLPPVLPHASDPCHVVLQVQKAVGVGAQTGEGDAACLESGDGFAGRGSRIGRDGQTGEGGEGVSELGPVEVTRS